MNRSASNCTLPTLALVLLSSAAWSATTISTIDGGGRRTASAHYRMDGSISSMSGISTAVSPAIQVRHGYIGQLYEVTNLVVTAFPSPVSETSHSQLSASALLDDGTVLVPAGSTVSWGAAMHPIASISVSGQVTPASVYTDTTGMVSGYYLGASHSIGLLVLDTDSDNYTIYASDGIPDWWQIQHFGPDSPVGVASADPDGDSLSNWHEYWAGTDPANGSSGLLIIATDQVGNDVRITWTTAGGRTNAVQATNGDADGDYATNFADISGPIVILGNGDVTTNYLDVGAVTGSPARYYRIRLVP